MTKSISSLFPRLVTFLMIAMLAIPGMLTSETAAQGTTAASDTSYESQLSGLAVETAGDFTITDTSVETYDQGDGEIVTIESGVSLVQVAFFDDADTAQTTVDLFNDGFSSEADDFELLDQGTEGDAIWSVSSATVNGSEFVFYISVTADVTGNVDVMTSMTAPADEFLTSLEDAQSDVTLDGDGIFAEADLDALDSVLGGSATASTETPQSSTGTTATTTKGSSKTTTGTTKGSEGTTSTTGQSQTQSGSGDVTVSEVTGIEVETSGDWQVSGTQVYDDSEPREESFQIQSPQANGYIGFFYGSDAQKSLDGFLGGFDSSAKSRDTIAADYQDGVAWSLDNAVLGDGTEVYVYTEVREGLDPEYVVLSAVLAEPDTFIDEFTGAQDSITLDGDPLFLDVDATNLEQLITGGAVATEEPQATTATTTTKGTDSGTAENPRDHAKLPGRDGTSEITSGNETETGAAGTATAGIDFTDAGLLSDSEYESPQFGVGVTWGPSWYIDYSDEESVTTDPSGGMDSLMLAWDGPDFALMFIDISTADGLAPADFVEYWTSQEYMSENVAPNGENLLERSRAESGAVLTRDYLDSGDEVIIVKEAILLNDGENLAIVTLISTPDSFGQLYGDAQDDVAIAGGSGLSTFTSRQVERAIGI